MEALGSKIRTASESIRKHQKPLDAGSASKNDAQPLRVTFMQIVISLVALVWGTLIILGVGDADTELKMAACGWVGTVIGYWIA